MTGSQVGDGKPWLPRLVDRDPRLWLFNNFRLSTADYVYADVAWHYAFYGAGFEYDFTR